MTKTIVKKYILSLTLSILLSLTGTILCSATDSNKEELFSDEVRKKVLKKVGFEDSSLALIQNYILIKLEYEKQKKKIDQLNLIQPKFTKGTFSSKKAKNVLMSHVGYTNHEHSYPIIGSFGANPCIIIGIYNPETKSAALCHLDSCTEITALKSMFMTLRPDEDSLLEIHFAGGDYIDDRLINIVNFVENQPHVFIKSAKLFSSDQMAIDARTGDIFDIFSPTQLNVGKDFLERLQKLDAITSKRLLIILDNFGSEFSPHNFIFFNDLKFLKIEPDLEPNKLLDTNKSSKIRSVFQSIKFFFTEE
ncbi:MAG: hypothetical protein ACRYGR_06265 [Janthinobacterium lividum]